MNVYIPPGKWVLTRPLRTTSLSEQGKYKVFYFVSRLNEELKAFKKMTIFY
jgi:hypothetical protein